MSLADIIGNNNVLVRSVNTARTAADSASPIMLIGETGTGKELFAQSIHNQSRRSNKPYIAVTCAPAEVAGAKVICFYSRFSSSDWCRYKLSFGK